MRKPLISLLLIFGWVVSAYSQTTISGTVNGPDGEALIGATVLEKGTANAVISGLEGKFVLEVSQLPTVIEASFVGYGSQAQDITDASQNLTFQLSEDAALLDEVVVTGLASSVKRSNLANSVAVVSADELTGVTSQSTAEGALYGKLSGAQIRANSGAPGGGFSVRLRGVTSIFGDKQPLYIIDGVYIDNKSISSGTNVVSQAAGGGNPSTNQDDASNRIADIDPEDIEKIEVLKGASAAAIYGSRAAGGVVLITTKKGKAGATKFTFAQDVGFLRPVRLLGQRQFDAQKVEDVFGASERTRFEQNGITDFEKELFDNSPLTRSTRLEISGGSETTTFFAGGTLKNDGGLVDNTGYDKKSIRLNINHKLSKRINVDLSTNYIDAESDRGFFNNGNTNTTVGYARAFTRPWDQLSADSDGVFPALPRVGSNILETISLVTNTESSNRFLGGLTINTDIYQNSTSDLTLQLRGGVDQYTLETTSIFPQALSFFREPGTLGGASISGSSINKNTNYSAFLVHSYYPNLSFEFRTQAGVTREDFNLNSVLATGTGLNGSQTSVDQAANFGINQFRQPQRDQGFFVQEEINWEDKLIGAFGVRGDKSTNNGDSDQLFYYPKANLAINLHEFDELETGVFSQLKLRGAYGESGRFAGFNDRFNLYNPTFIGTSSGLVSSATRGNPNIEPEKQSEIEFGTDIGLLDNMVNLEATYYIKTIDDLLLRAQVPTSSGFTRQVINGGKLRNNGVELALRAEPLRNSNSKLNWSTDVRWWTNNSEIKELDVPAFNEGGFAASLGTYRIEVGESPTQIVGTFDSDDCSDPDCLDLDPNQDGFRVYGNAEPDFNMSWTNNLGYENLELSFLWHWKQGGQGINLSTLLYDLGNTTWDYDDRTLDPTGQQVNGDYRKNVNGAEPWIEDNGYLRMREAGLYYRMPRSMFNDRASVKVGLSGRNLINIFDYNSYDPEVSNFGNNVLANTVEVTPFPSAKTYAFHVKAIF